LVIRTFSPPPHSPRPHARTNREAQEAKALAAARDEATRYAGRRPRSALGSIPAGGGGARRSAVSPRPTSAQPSSARKKWWAGWVFFGGGRRGGVWWWLVWPGF